MSRATKVISPGEITAGIDVAILEDVESNETKIPVEFGIWAGHADTRSQWAGVPLRVTAIDIPFVVTRTLQGGVFIIDTRQHKLMELKPEFAAACRTVPAEEHHPRFQELVLAHNHVAETVRRHEDVLVQIKSSVDRAISIIEAPPPPKKRDFWLMWVGLTAAVYTAIILLAKLTS